MGRYRPPVTPGSKYITPVGKEKLQQEHDYLWQEKRPQITRSVQEAAAQGDRSENAEYIYGKKQLREIDYRVRHLRKRLADITVVDAIPEEQDRVFFGAWVSLEDEAGEINEYRIVGPDEFDDADEYISMDAPLAKALLKRRLDDEVVVHLPQGEKRYFITAIRYC
ncbi:MAG: transcription elongation factor GreB [Gammaproteobacteria bacterium]|jgi:transcription elongation factor GreB|nr:transcription elongation factor GreB [Gammaproteobacteria bacterium]